MSRIFAAAVMSLARMMRPPNQLWIVTTQWRAHACGHAGDPNAHTPGLDALAAESVNFVEAVTPHPFGPFARAALLTGVRSPENGLRDYYDALPRGARTVAHELRARGYETAFFGKWHLAERDRNAPLVGEAHARTVVPPDARGGFDFWEGFEGGFLLNDPFLHGTRLPESTRIRGYQSDVLCERAQGWLRRDGPWFCIVSLEPPHPPYDAPSAGMNTQSTEEIQLRRNVPGRPAEIAERARRELAGYYAHIEATDRAIGRLVAGLGEETVVAFTSVHGDMHGSHGHFRKGWPYEESVRVPLLLRMPRVAARQDHAGISLLDLSRVAIQLAQGEPPRLARDGARISMPSVVPFPHQCDRMWSGWRTPQRKLILNADGSPWLFFNLETDPLEMENLVARPEAQPEIAALRTRILTG